jgi:Fe-S oxidoreductase
MATYKAEFLAHYYEGRLRPRTAYAMGWIHRWSRLAGWMPNVVNAVLHAPLLGAVAKALAGIAPARDVPFFAPETFVDWFAARLTVPPDGNSRFADWQPTVILWPDTFNNNFFPEVLKAAVRVLEAAGYRIVLPGNSLCCGRPLYDFGMLDRAKKLLRQTLDTLRPMLAAGIPIVGLEPSCVAVFRDEILNLFPTDTDAHRLSENTFLLAEFLEQRSPEFSPPKLKCRALVHGHCHQKALIGMAAETKLFAKLGLDHAVLDSGCCGMAGSFGFERDHYDVSRRVGELILLPEVRDAGLDTMIIADGFSCREQIAQLTNRRALHSAQILAMALDGNVPPPGRAPESAITESRRRVNLSARRRGAATLGLTALAACAFVLANKIGSQPR